MDNNNNNNNNNGSSENTNRNISFEFIHTLKYNIFNVPNSYAPGENKNNTHKKFSFISTAYESSVLGIIK